ncbi:MAG TPA: hypothetical protein VK191_06500 [Symbiobacteriaceae bacterium]|nr:hypothetical protein [Symbiobacteriaceae bacterium]
MELLGVLCIILLLTTFAVPVYANVTDQARQAKSKRALEVIQDALEGYKAKNGHYPDRLGLLITDGHLKQSADFHSPWSSSIKEVYYFYAANGRDDSATAYALGDPGRETRCKKTDWKGPKHAALREGSNGHIPCGRYPTEPGWIFNVPDTEQYGSTLDLLDPDGVLYPPGVIKTLVGFCCDDLIKEQ